jgi:hypothetical protein
VERRLALRRLLLIGTPLVLTSLMVVHQLIDQLQRPGAFLALHLLLLPLFALMGVALWALLEGVGGAVAWAARVAAFVFLVGYVALDAISGIAASAILASGAPWSKEATRALFGARNTHVTLDECRESDTRSQEQRRSRHQDRNQKILDAHVSYLLS